MPDIVPPVGGPNALDLYSAEQLAADLRRISASKVRVVEVLPGLFTYAIQMGKGSRARVRNGRDGRRTITGSPQKVAQRVFDL